MDVVFLHFDPGHSAVETAVALGIGPSRWQCAARPAAPWVAGEGAEEEKQAALP
ncbi:hypothetical protein [Streptomyces sp. NPDC093591]|uniref:hypothetical protein n=1 Tax=Streptomyces sp. NPDC093591 TaxID=3366044 RepID=UPI00381E33BE